MSRLNDLRIVLCYPVEPCHRDAIQTAAPGATVVDAGQERIAREILQADIFCGHAKVPVPWDDVVRQGRLRWIQSSAAGLDHCLVPSIKESTVVVSSCSGVFADQVAEQTVCLLLALIRELPTFFRAQQQKTFERLPTNDLQGKTVGIVGFGGNGRRIAEVLSTFKVRIVATDMFPERKPVWVDQLWGAEHLPRLLAESDVVILCLPLNDQTAGFFGTEILAQMRQRSVLINVARGPIIVERDLVAALLANRFSGVGLDVTEVEPLPVTSPLWEMPQVLITPHVGAQSANRIDAVTRLFCDNLLRYESGKPPYNLVDKQLGFPRPEDNISLQTG